MSAKSHSQVRAGTAHSLLISAYGKWREWTQAESDAIRQSDWPTVARFQRAKHRLQSVIVRCTERASVERQGQGLDPAQMLVDLRPIIRELIVLETNNGALVLECKSRAQTERTENDLTGRNLSRVRRSYAVARPACWESYS